MFLSLCLFGKICIQTFDYLFVQIVPKGHGLEMGGGSG